MPLRLKLAETVNMVRPGGRPISVQLQRVKIVVFLSTMEFFQPDWPTGSCELSKLGWSDGKLAPPMTWHVKLQIARSRQWVNRLPRRLQRSLAGPSPYRVPNLMQFRCPWRLWDLISRQTANFSVLTLQQISGRRNWMDRDRWIFLQIRNAQNLDYRMGTASLKSGEGKFLNQV